MSRKSQSFQCKLAALSMVLVSESISSTLILPFVGLYVAHLHKVSPDEAGFLSGILVSVFHLGQMLTAKTWGRMSDRFGRKPMIQLGLFFNAVASAFFGMSPCIEFCVLMRFFHGCANGNVLVAKTVIADITDKTNESLGFSTISLFWGVGSIVGPTVGGLLYDPGKNSAIGHFFSFDEQTTNILVLHPALLPAMVITVFSIFVLMCTSFFLPETSKNVVDPLLSLCFRGRPTTVVVESEVVEEDARQQDFEGIGTIAPTEEENAGAINRLGDSPSWLAHKGTGRAIDDVSHCTVAVESSSVTTGMRSRRQGAVLEDVNDGESKAFSTFGYRDALQSQSTRVVLVMYMCIASTECALLEVVPLWAIASVEKGGLNLTSPDVGWLMGAASVVCVIANINFSLISRWVQNNRFLWDASVIVWALTSVATPCAVFIPREWVFTYVAVVTSVREVGLSWAYALIYLFVARSAPEAHVGSMNGVAQAIGSLARMLTMLVIPPMFAWSLQSMRGFPFNHHFVFWLTNIPLLSSYFLSAYLSSLVLCG
ncbi:putative transporter [Trypanosoma grayi]|uniref:putative transporter n=1 Tax=Trypanosoma grayi TaxID=71804 RepID=UPI0004F46D32|nr:putative transporter [Trypanosoma grayi]KEG15208.1 putative transporter [Trypanosoma grayi]